MSRRWYKLYPGQAWATDPQLGITFDFGITVPADNDPGYAPNCLFQDLDATGGSGLYINRGTKAAANFDLLPDLAALTATIAEINSALTGIGATAAELTRAADMDTRVVAATTTPLAITAALHDQKTIYITKTDGIAITLPVPVAGMKFRFFIGATIASASTIKSVAGTHIMIGHALMGNNSDNTVVLWQATAADTFDTINLLGTSNSTGGMEGQTITIEAMSATVWLVEICGDASGTEATPFENTVT